MILTTLTVAGTSYALEPGEDIDALKSRAVAAAQAGGGMVEFDAAGDRRVSFLVTPATALALEQREVLPQPDHSEPWSERAYDFIDFGDY